MFAELERAKKRHCRRQKNTCKKRLREKITNMMIKIFYFANPPKLFPCVKFYVSEFA